MRPSTDRRRSARHRLLRHESPPAYGPPGAGEWALTQQDVLPAARHFEGLEAGECGPHGVTSFRCRASSSRRCQSASRAGSAAISGGGDMTGGAGMR